LLQFNKVARIKIYNVGCAIECNFTLSNQQVSKINNVLKENDIFDLVIFVNGKTITKQSFRPIRGITYLL